MRGHLDRQKLESFMKGLAGRVHGAGRVYLVGGATAVLWGWRESAIEPELIRYPAIDPAEFRRAVREFCRE